MNYETEKIDEAEELSCLRILELSLLLNNEIGELNHHLAKGLLQLTLRDAAVAELKKAIVEIQDLKADGLLEELEEEIDKVIVLLSK